jgi:hypothetical protein
VVDRCLKLISELRYFVRVSVSDELNQLGRVPQPIWHPGSRPVDPRHHHIGRNRDAAGAEDRRQAVDILEAENLVHKQLSAVIAGKILE